MSTLREHIGYARRDLVRKCVRCQKKGEIPCDGTGKLCSGARRLWSKLDKMENSSPEISLSPDTVIRIIDRYFA